ncbi:hypothetical protein GCM10011348_02820 [Marinobacterium nitratireducens]|uniref:Uncharacterized protein n=1 Tax=Marinobacterium nitratireducens TaxID=518897 RepID=A0A918DN55_9GAMM|nr:hypothetical protein [Marinobacterium nitratireducens]GGO76194.1 hypothetical protein GCM10011348_02820 [Marinobacterium nitratireducens]
MLTPCCDANIRTLRIRGPADAQDRVSRNLQQASWPETGADEIVFVRQIHVTGSADRIAPALLDQVRRHLHHDGDPGNIMRFASEQDMLAALLSDLAAGVAAQRWYWRRWSRLFGMPPGQAIGSLLADNLTHLNALTQRLHGRQQLARVWQALDDRSAEQLIAELCWKNGYRLDSRATAPRSRADVRLAPQVLARWRPALQTLTPDSPRFQLSALLMAQESAPLMLIQSATATVSAIAKRLGDTTGNGPVPSPVSAAQSTAAPPPGPRPATESTPQSARHGAAAKPSASAYKPAAPGESCNRALDNRRPSRSDAPTISIQALPASGGTAQSPAPDSENPRPHPLHRVAIRAPDDQQTGGGAEPEFYTGQGGALYLLNFLNRPGLQAIMADYREALPSGWIWLYRVAQLLDLNEQDPLTSFLAMQLGLDDREDLAALPALPERPRIEALAQDWYGASGLWQPSLLALPARVRYSASHLDMHLEMSHTRLEVRLAGLDLNPGWLPWLGRVVQFHFGQRSDHR